MKTIPRFTDMMAKADVFVEDRTDAFIRHRYFFKNGKGISLIMFNDSFGKGKVKVSILAGNESDYEMTATFTVTSDIEIREVLDEIEKIEAKD